jgi:hypothetical protein
MTLIRGTALSELLALRAEEEVVVAGGSEEPSAGTTVTPITFIVGGELLGLAMALAGAETAVESTKPVPKTLIWRFPNDLALARPSILTALAGRQ